MLRLGEDIYTLLLTSSFSAELALHINDTQKEPLITRHQATKAAAKEPNESTFVPIKTSSKRAFKRKPRANQTDFYQS